MEDFGSIIWTVVLIGFAIFSVVAKGREKQAKQQHQEAWPSWDEDSDAEKSLEAQHAEEARMSEQSRAYGSSETLDNYESAETYQEEAQSLEVIPDREYVSLEESSTAMSGSLNPNTATQVSGRNAFVNTASNALKGHSQVFEPQPNTDEIHDEIALEEDTNNLTTDFDLRKAVIYSEIMKPKFSE